MGNKQPISVLVVVHTADLQVLLIGAGRLPRLPGTGDRQPRGRRNPAAKPPGVS